MTNPQPSPFEIILYSLINLLPYLFIALYMFQDDLRFNLQITLLITALLSVIQVFLGYAAIMLYSQYVWLISLLCYAVYILFYLSAVKASPGPLLFMIFIVINYAVLVVSLSKFIEYHFFPAMALQRYRWT